MPQTPCLFAPFNRSCMAQHVGCTFEADLGRDVGALDQLAEASDCERCTALGNKIERPIWPRALVPAAPAIHPRAFGNLHLSPSAANSDIPIK